MADTVANTCSEFPKVLADENQEMVSEWDQRKTVGGHSTVGGFIYLSSLEPLACIFLD